MRARSCPARAWRTGRSSDPKGQPLGIVRQIRDDIRAKVEDLIAREWLNHSNHSSLSRDCGVCRAEDAEHAEKRGGDRVASPIVARAGDPAASAPLCVLGALCATHSAISAREPGHRVVKPVLVILQGAGAVTLHPPASSSDTSRSTAPSARSTRCQSV